MPPLRPSLLLLLLATTARAAEPSPPVVLSVTAVESRTKYSRDAFAHGHHLQFKIVLKNVSQKIVRVEKRLQDALLVDSIHYQGRALVRSVASIEPEAGMNDLAPTEHVGPLAPGEQVETTLDGLCKRYGRGEVRELCYAADGPGDYQIVFRYEVAGHFAADVIVGPLRSSPVTVTMTR